MQTNLKWTLIGEDKAEAFLTETSTPGIVYGRDPELLPDNFTDMPGVSSYYARDFITPQSCENGFTVRGEMVVSRADDDLMKNYLYVFAQNSEGAVFFKGPYKNFAGHHVNSGQGFPAGSIFGNTPFSGS
ncbi:MAG: hypothetical protein O7H41_11520 [Planctomycetota bacterium]|nr:hypothetical protein [Planctomycetota bacterium]